MKILFFLILLLLCASDSWATINAYDWRIYQNSVGDPTTPYAAQNTIATLNLNPNNDIVRIRLVMEASNSTFVTFTMEYSTDDSTFTTVGSAHAWNWATTPGGTNGSAVAGLLISDANAYGVYLNSNSLAAISTGEYMEYDFEIQPTSTAIAGQKYYFRANVGGSNVSPAAGGYTDPQIITTNVTSSNIQGNSTIGGNSTIN